MRASNGFPKKHCDTFKLQRADNAENIVSCQYKQLIPLIFTLEIIRFCKMLVVVLLFYVLYSLYFTRLASLSSFFVT